MLRNLLKMCQTKNQLKISIEGNIASGKSSIINYLKASCLSKEFSPNGRHVNLNIFPEPVNEWRNLNGTNLLELMYKDPSHWSLAFHSYVHLTMLQNHVKMNNNNNKNNDEFNLAIMERSIYSAKYCFLKNIHESNNIKPAEYEVLKNWFHWIVNSHDCSLDLIFYLKTNPETCLDRIQMRGREEEVNTVSLNYLQRLHDYHESWLINENNSIQNEHLYRPKHVIVIDADRSLDDVCKKVEYETKNAAYLAN